MLPHVWMLIWLALDGWPSSLRWPSLSSRWGWLVIELVARWVTGWSVRKRAAHLTQTTDRDQAHSVPFRFALAADRK